MTQGANPRIDVQALPPGPLWWISKVKSIPTAIYTFQRDDTPTWIFAKQHAEVFWREYICAQFTPENHRENGMQIENLIQSVLKEQQTTLWE